jgi:hypothetical protein
MNVVPYLKIFTTILYFNFFKLGKVHFVLIKIWMKFEKLNIFKWSGPTAYPPLPVVRSCPLVRGPYPLSRAARVNPFFSPSLFSLAN